MNVFSLCETLAQYNFPVLLHVSPFQLERYQFRKRLDGAKAKPEVMPAAGECPVGRTGSMPQQSGGCPVAHAPQAAERPAAQESGGRCPFGYDQKSSSKLSPLHCAM